MQQTPFRLRQLDSLISLMLFLGGLRAYTMTLAPSVLDGDAALFQYIPYVLGVTYPTGYPIYILLAKLWLWLFPFGEIAWRMNLFSALCGSLALPIIYAVARHLFQHRLAALSSVLLYATLPTYWRWATEAKIYTLNILLFSSVLWLAVANFDQSLSNESFPGNAKHSWRNRTLAWITAHRYKLGAFCLGLQIGVHSTTLLLIPGLILLFYLQWRRERLAHGLSLSLKAVLSPILQAIPFFLLPAVSYLYIPLRAEMLLTQLGREEAIARGLLADFYHSGWSGWLRYFSAADFTGGVVTNWSKVPEQLWTVYLTKLLPLDFTWGIILGGIIGFISLFGRATLRQRAWPLTLIYALPIPFVLTYGQGEQSAFLLTSNLVFSLFVGACVMTLPYLAETYLGPRQWLQLGSYLILGLFLMRIVVQKTQANIHWLTNKWDRAAYTYWQDVLHHPLAEKGTIMATWGDLTSMWYMQHVEGLRPDLWGLYPPTENLAQTWLVEGNRLYIGGPTLDTWQQGVEKRYAVVPWGRLVLLAPKETDTHALLRPLQQESQARFGQQLQVLGYEFQDKVKDGDQLNVTINWFALADLPPKTYYSLRLVEGDRIVAQKDDLLHSGWFPLDYIPANQPFIGYYQVPILAGTWPNTYHLQLAIYHHKRQEWPLENGASLLDLGQVAVQWQPATTSPSFNRFAGEIALDHSEFSVNRVGQGKGFAVHLLWHTLKSPQEDYILLVDMLDQAGHVWRSWSVPTQTSQWQAGQQVRQQVDVILPAEAPVGENALQIRLSWLRSDGSTLPYQRWHLPAGQSLIVGQIQVVEKGNRLFDSPSIQKPLRVNLDNKVALIGFQLPDQVQLKENEGTKLNLTLYWQGLDEMDQVYEVFVHVLNQENKIVAQHDRVPGIRGKQGTTSWAVGEYIIDPIEIALPSDLASGTYAIVVGMYLPPLGPRLPQVDEEGTVLGDAVQLGQLSISNYQIINNN